MSQRHRSQSDRPIDCTPRSVRPYADADPHRRHRGSLDACGHERIMIRGELLCPKCDGIVTARPQEDVGDAAKRAEDMCLQDTQEHDV